MIHLIHRLNRLADKVYKQTGVAVLVAERESNSFTICVPTWQPMENLSYADARTVLNHMRDTTRGGG